jgi:hypothetical protein
MDRKIQIRDGNPWWLSQDIWIVPGNDPNNSPGIPIAGQTNYLWAKVHNVGNQKIENTRINFYWSNPASGVFRSNSTLIGFSFVDLEAGETKEVLCLTPWIPVIVNDGHECLVVEAVTPYDPLPTPLPDEFDPPIYHQVAQRNLHILVLNRMMDFIVFPIQLSASLRIPKDVIIKVENGKLDKEMEKEIFHQIGIKKIPEFNEKLVEFGISKNGDCNYSKEVIGDSSLKLKIEGGNSVGVYLHLKQNDQAKSGYQLINIIETFNDKVQGGNTFLIFKK